MIGQPSLCRADANSIDINATNAYTHVRITPHIHPYPYPLQLGKGPPGCGKTHFLAVLIRALARQGSRVLVCAPSNKVSDTLLCSLRMLQYTASCDCDCNIISLRHSGCPPSFLVMVPSSYLSTISINRQSASRWKNTCRLEARYAR